MISTDGPLKGLKIISPTIFRDERGEFLENYKLSNYNINFVQDNLSYSKLGTIRGLHYQLERPQGKLVSVCKGMIQDIAIDIRKSSPTFGKHFSVILSSSNHKQLYIPEGFAHGFLALTEEAIVAYKCTAEYHKESERTIIWNDPTINILWAAHVEEFIISDKDQKGTTLLEADVFD
jgi:dTDP-4-dehydrorhamnose 3,5-epimerase